MDGFANSVNSPKKSPPRNLQVTCTSESANSTLTTFWSSNVSATWSLQSPLLRKTPGAAMAAVVANASMRVNRLLRIVFETGAPSCHELFLFIFAHRLLERGDLFEQFLKLHPGQTFQYRRQLRHDS